MRMAVMQALLRVGIVRSKRAPTKTHPYGYMKDKFVWSLVSAVGIFCLGAGVTCAHGVSSLMSPPQQLEHLGYGIAGAPRAALASCSLRGRKRCCHAHIGSAKDQPHQVHSMCTQASHPVK